jgi:protocatechuate 3,4-dioxygenase beta subunit
MNVRVSGYCTFALFIGLAVDGTAQVRDNAAAVAGSASIAGTIVTDAEPPRPVRRALVSIIMLDRTVDKTIVTDDNGRFVVGGLPAGRYNVSASKRGWVSASYGSKGPGKPGTTVALENGQRASLSIRLPRGAVISGTLLDETGQAPPGATIRAMRYTYFTGERRLSFAGGGLGFLNERGQYRVYGLPPGEYYVVATVGVGGPFRVSSDLHLTSDVDVEQATRAVQQGAGASVPDVPQRSVSLVPVYYPGVNNTAQASPITVQAGEERTGVDFVMPYVGSAHIDGTVTAPDGTPATNTTVTMVNADVNAASLGFDAIRTSRTDPQGKFSFAGVTPGSYLLDGRTTVGWVDTLVEVQGEDIRGLALAMQETFSVSGSVRFDGTAAVPGMANVRLSLVSLPTPGGVTISAMSNTTAGADGQFTFVGVAPGRYRLTAGVPAARPTWIVRSSTLGAQDALDAYVDVRQALSDAAIVFTDQLAELNGHVTPNTTVILFTTNQSQWSQQSRRLLTARAANDGSFVFRTVPPGEYHVAVVDEIEPGQWNDPAYLQTLVPSATKITITEGEKKTFDLRATGG